MHGYPQFLRKDIVAGSRRFEGGWKKVFGKLNAAVRICQTEGTQMKSTVSTTSRRDLIFVVP